MSGSRRLPHSNAMSDKRSSQLDLPEGKDVSARDIAAVWPCSSLVAPLPIAHLDPGPSAKGQDLAARRPFANDRSGPQRLRNILVALLAISKNGLL
ncbi:hypothetical protein [Sphingopyxis fribergensis]